jgi:hypothetical protein
MLATGGRLLILLQKSRDEGRSKSRKICNSVDVSK